MTKSVDPGRQGARLARRDEAVYCCYTTRSNEESRDALAAWAIDLAIRGPLVYDANFLSVPKEGGTPTVLMTTASRIADFAVNATHLFWADADATTLSRVDLAGGLAEIVVSDTAPSCTKTRSTREYTNFAC